MITYDVHLEIDDEGHHMAHVLALPGCTARANDRAACLAALGDAVAAHHAWLRRHGEPAPPDGISIELSVVEEVTGTGPFGPGDAAALFAPDRAPLGRDEMEAYVRLMGHARADLLALVADLPDDALDWEPGPDQFSIRRVVRHVGNAEEWYVSRLVAADTLPHEWATDEDMPLLAFLEMERRTAIDRLQRLSDEELTGVLHPTAWTRHPDEAWTARKALRRFLEHEIEHTHQVREVLTLCREAVVAELDSARKALLDAVSRVPAAERATRCVCGAWTMHDVVAHIVAWERFGVDGLRDMARGQPPGQAAISNIDAWNAAAVESRRCEPWSDLWQDLIDTRRDLLSVLGELDPVDLWRAFPFPWGGEGTPYDWISVFATHDLEHAEQETGKA